MVLPDGRRRSSPGGSFARQASAVNLERMVWDLLDHYRSSLSELELRHLFVQLGGGEHLEVVTAVLEAGMADGVPLPARLVGQVLTWVDGYSGHADYGRLRALVIDGVTRC